MQPKLEKYGIRINLYVNINLLMFTMNEKHLNREQALKTLEYALDNVIPQLLKITPGKINLSLYATPYNTENTELPCEVEVTAQGITPEQALTLLSGAYASLNAL